MEAYEFFSLFSINMTLAILFILIFFENKKLAVRFGLFTFFVTVSQFILLNMTPLSEMVKDIIVIITLLLYFIIVTGQILVIIKEHKIVEKIEERRKNGKDG